MKVLEQAATKQEGTNEQQYELGEIISSGEVS